MRSIWINLIIFCCTNSLISQEIGLSFCDKYSGRSFELEYLLKPSHDIILSTGVSYHFYQFHKKSIDDNLRFSMKPSNALQRFGVFLKLKKMFQKEILNTQAYLEYSAQFNYSTAKRLRTYFLDERKPIHVFYYPDLLWFEQTFAFSLQYNKMDKIIPYSSFGISYSNIYGYTYQIAPEVEIVPKKYQSLQNQFIGLSLMYRLGIRFQLNSLIKK